MTGVTLLRLAIASVFLVLLAGTWADPDLWGHLRFGADIVAAGGVPRSDPYGFTSAPTWVNQSWLGDVLMHLAFAGGGTPGLVAGKLLVAGGSVGMVAWTLHRAGVGGPLLELLLFLCLATLYPSTPAARPQLFSLLLFALLLAVQVRRETPETTRLLVVPLVMAAWANLHGAWLVGLGELGLWTAVEIVVSDRGWRHRASLAGIGILACLATLATPYGVDLWVQLWRTMGTSLRDVTEWRGLLETGAPALAVWCALVGLAAYAVRSAGGRVSRVLVLFWLAYASWRVRRLLPFFGLATVMLLAPQFATLSRGRALPRLERGQPLRAGLRVGLVAAALALIVLNTWQAVRAFGCLRMDYSREADVRAAAFIAQNHLRGRLLAYSDWGVYAIWHFAPGIRVWIDGRREFAYPLDEIARHNAIYWNAPSALDDVDALAPDYIWLPTHLPVLPTLEHRGWRPIFRTDRSVVLTRSPATSYDQPADRPLPPCFPADPL